MDHNAVEATKNICCAKGEDAVDHRTITEQWFKKFHSGCKNLKNQARLGRPKTVDFKAVLQAIETNREYQASLASHSPVWLITFTTSIKAPGTAKLCLLLAKFCKT